MTRAHDIGHARPGKTTEEGAATATDLARERDRVGVVAPVAEAVLRVNLEVERPVRLALEQPDAMRVRFRAIGRGRDDRERDGARRGRAAVRGRAADRRAELLDVVERLQRGRVAFGSRRSTTRE
jgi:hypothetical protein